MGKNKPIKGLGGFDPSDNRRALKSAGNKIVKTLRSIKSQAEYLYDYQKQFGNKYGTVPKETIESLLRKYGRRPKGHFKSGFDALKSQLEVRANPPTDWHSKVIDKTFQKELGLIDDKGKPTAKNVRKEGPRARWRPLRNPARLALTGGPVSNDQMRILDSYNKHLQEIIDKQNRNSRRINLVSDRRELNRQYRNQFIKSGLGNVGAGIVLHALSDKFLVPLARKAGTKLGKSLIPVGRKIDQLLIRKKKKDD